MIFYKRPYSLRVRKDGKVIWQSGNTNGDVLKAKLREFEATVKQPYAVESRHVLTGQWTRIR